MALWDWSGQRIGQPLCRMLAIDPSQTPLSSYTISIDAADAIEQQVRDATDWPILKVKLGGGDQDEAIVRQLRRVTERPFRVDANEAWTEDEAIEKIAWLATVGCELVEQPLPAGDLDGMALLHGRSALPLVADEDAPDAQALSDLVGRYHAVNVKLMKCGGIREAVRMIHTARQLDLDVMLGCFVESSIAITAAAHLSPLARWVDLDGAALLAEDPFRGAEVEAGAITLPTRPGLGVTPAG
jgi:L-alanine-DL-glutamate epimerase-like enolase superfamily enzyme